MVLYHLFPFCCEAIMRCGVHFSEFLMAYLNETFCLEKRVPKVHLLYYPTNIVVRGYTSHKVILLF